MSAAATIVRHVAVYAPALAALLLLHWSTIRLLLRDWLTYDASYGLVIVAISVGMAVTATKRLVEAGSLPRPSLWAGGVVTLLGSLAFLAGNASQTIVLLQLSLFVAVFGLAWLFLGTEYIKALIIPILYLSFSTTLPTDLLGRYSIHLQVAAARIAEFVLALTGMPVVRTKAALTLPHITLEVVKACNGINHIVALMSLVIPLAFFTRVSTLRKCFLVILSFILGITLNGLRIAMIGWWSTRHADLHGPLSMLFTSVIFFVGFMILLLVNYDILRGRNSDRRIASATARTLSGQSWRRAAIASGIAILLLTAAVAAVRWHPSLPVLVDPGARLPDRIGSWVGTGGPQGFSPFRKTKPDYEFSRVYRDPSGQEVGVYVGHFAVQRQGNEVVNPESDELHAGSSEVRIAGHAGESLRVLRVERGGERAKQVVYFWYDANGRMITGRVAVKLAMVADWLFRRRTNGALVAVYAADDRGAQVDLLVQMLPELGILLRGSTQ